MRPRLFILTAATFLIFSIWFASALFWAQIPIHTAKSLNCIDFSVGRIWLVHYSVSGPVPPFRGATRWSFIADVGEDGWRLLPTFQHDPGGTPLPVYNNALTFHWHLGLPLYPFFLATGIPAALMWRTWFRQHRDARIGHCKSCGYDLSGLTGPCPVCGAAQNRQSCHGPRC